MDIVISGQTPSKKNSRNLFIRNGKQVNIPNKKYLEWEQNAMQELSIYKGQADGKVMIDYMFYVVDRRRRDLSNMIQSVEDVLVKKGLIKDDAWEYVCIGSADAAVDKDNPRVEFSIHELE